MRNTIHYTLGADCPCTVEVSGSTQLSAGGALALTAVICSTVFFIFGALFGILCFYFIVRCKRSHTMKSGQSTAVMLSQLPVPIYEDIDKHRLDKPASPQSPENKQTIDLELKENVAYGPI